jgi:cholesterol transport system auxiliary component
VRRRGARCCAGRAAGLAVLLPTLLLGCAAPGPAPQDSFYSLQARPTVAPAPPARSLAATLLVQDLSARGFLGGRQIVYRTEAEPLQVQRYPRLLWEEPPGRALAAELVTALRAAGPFELVLGWRQRARNDYVLRGELLRFEHRPTATQPYVAAAFTLTLLRASDRGVLMNQRFSGEEPTDGETPKAMVSAFNRLSGRLISEAAVEMGRVSSGR